MIPAPNSKICSKDLGIKCGLNLPAHSITELTAFNRWMNQEIASHRQSSRPPAGSSMASFKETLSGYNRKEEVWANSRRCRFPSSLHSPLAPASHPTISALTITNHRRTPPEASEFTLLVALSEWVGSTPITNRWSFRWPDPANGRKMPPYIKKAHHVLNLEYNIQKTDISSVKSAIFEMIKATTSTPCWIHPIVPASKEKGLSRWKPQLLAGFEPLSRFPISDPT